MRQGFTAVELLITLFIAVMMVISGYQLYNSITIRNARVRNMSEASTIAYNALRENSSYVSTSTSCGTSHVAGSISAGTVSVANTLPYRSASLPPQLQLYRCRPLSDNTVIRVTAIVRYDSPVREAVHAIYVSP